ncbi:hypothetical protein HZB02_04490 [Candidatus Woesearchaeota archaeon]|nr:hypothetical protein [Candidatus Woesearchaeota archaeon]
MGNLDNLVVTSISDLKECTGSLANMRRLDPPQKYRDVTFGLKSRCYVSYEDDFLPVFSESLQSNGITSTEPRGNMASGGSFDGREFPFTYLGVEAFFLSYPVFEMGQDSRSCLGITFIQQHPEHESIEKRS